jgi:hypothetical protein
MYKFVVYFSCMFSICMGVLLLYRASANRDDFISLERKVIVKKIELLPASTKRTAYALLFELENYNEILGIYIGTKKQANNSEIINLIKPDSIYTFLIDPSIMSHNGSNLGIREIIFRNKSIFKQTSKFNFVGGTILICFGLVGFFILAKLKRRKNSS